MAQINLLQAINSALDIAMAENDRTVCFGGEFRDAIGSAQLDEIKEHINKYRDAYQLTAAGKF